MLLNLALLITNIKNASRINSIFTYVNYTKRNLLILSYFLKYKLIKNYLVIPNSYKIKVFVESESMKYIESLNLHSKSSLRKYTKFKQLLKLSNGCYFGLVSTNIGVLSIQEAVLRKKSGEILCLIKYI